MSFFLGSKGITQIEEGRIGGDWLPVQSCPEHLHRPEGKGKKGKPGVWENLDLQGGC